MTTLLTNKQADALRSIGDSAMVLFALWMIDQNYPGRMTKPRELLPYLYPIIKDLRKLETQLNALCASGRIAQTTAGYVLIEGGKALLLEMTGKEVNALALSPVSATTYITAGTELQAQALEVIDGNAIDVFSVDVDAQNAPKNTTHNVRASLLKKIERKEEDLIFKNSSSFLSVLENAQNVQLSQNAQVEISPMVVGYTFEDGTPIYQMECIDETFVTTRDILAATEVLEGFGEIMAKLPLDAIKPEHALVWIAKAWNDRATLTNAPAGLLVSKLRDISNPRPGMKYLKNPTQFLPDEYCERLHLAKYECKSCVDAKFSKISALEEHIQQVHTAAAIKQDEQGQSTESLVSVNALDGTHPASRAWESVLSQLQEELPRAQYNTWVRGTQPVELDGSVLTVAVRNAYARDWLESRLASIVSVMLKNIMNQSVTVRFIVAQVEDAEDSDD